MHEKSTGCFAHQSYALWQARCALAKAPLDLAGAFPGVWCCSPEQVRSERRSHPLWHGANGGLLG
eukprot:scaffold21293_cov36-Phaeocystis_antarctica.AAC.1